MDKKWIEITVLTSQTAADVISNRLIESGSLGTVFEDDPDDPEAYSIKAYYPQPINESEIVGQIQRYLDDLEQLGEDIGKGEVVAKWIESADWSSNWKQYFKPIRVGKHLVIKPSWEVFDKGPSDIVIEIDPGMAFGSGLHASTRLALVFLEHYVRKGARVLDVGVGSGILSIVSAHLGAGYVLGVDTDSQAVAIARENLRINSLDSNQEASIRHRVELLVSSIDTLPIRGLFDCIVMNLRPNIIVPLIPYVKAFLQTGGALILSGILEEEGAELLHDLRAFDLIVQNHLAEDDWIAYVLSQMSSKT